MSMHSMGQAWAHWKHVSHLRPPCSSYSSWRRPRNFVATSAGISGYMIVAFGAKNRRRVSAMPFTMPRPGTTLGRKLTSRTSLAEAVDDDDRERGHEQVEQRRRKQPLPGEAHELVDADARQGRPHPDEHEHERERLA